MTPEGKVKKEVKEFLDSLGADCWYYMPVPTGYGRKGIPDFLCCYKGAFFAIECKAPGKEYNTTPWQDKEIESITKATGDVFTVSNTLAFKQAFCQLFKTTVVHYF